MKILLIEDNSSICKGLEYAFKSNGYDCEIANSINSSKYLINNYQPQLIVLDVSLPDGNGFDLYLDTIKKLNIPTIFLTARDSEDDIVKGLEIGANDYITKPFSTRELIVRINKILSKNARIIKVKDIKFDMDKMQVYKNNEIVNLTSLELKILYLLFSNLNKAVTRNYLIEYIYNLTGNDVNDNTITVYLKRIREKIGNNIIITIKGIGYRIENEEK